MRAEAAGSFCSSGSLQRKTGLPPNKRVLCARSLPICLHLVLSASAGFGPPCCLSSLTQNDWDENADEKIQMHKEKWPGPFLVYYMLYFSYFFFFYIFICSLPHSPNDVIVLPNLSR